MKLSYKLLLPLFAVSAVLILGSILFWPKPEPLPLPVAVDVPSTEIINAATSSKRVIGKSVEGRAIEYLSFGTGSTSIIFVGGIHGGYEWNSVLLAYDLIAALQTETFLIPKNITIGVIPVLNPDGLFSVIQKTGVFTREEIPENDAHTTGRGRFNARNVDLNRNFDCKWQPTSTWRGRVVSAGTAPFSEPEALALRDLVLEIKPTAVIFWHSQANTVYASECEAGVLPLTRTLMNLYANAASYQAVEAFDAYPVSGDAEGWLASLGIAALTVELETRTQSEWNRNQLGVEAIVSHLSASANTNN